MRTQHGLYKPRLQCTNNHNSVSKTTNMYVKPLI